MNVVWRRVILRRLLEERARTLVTLLGVALGVAVFVAIRLASHSALSSFGETVDAVAGKANLQISASSEGLDERLYPAIRALPGVRAAAPAVEVQARLRPVGGRTGAEGWVETALVLGLDPLAEVPFARVPEAGTELRGALALMAEPGTAALPRGLAERHGLAEGGRIALLASGRPETLTVRVLLESAELDRALGGNLVVLDIATAQEVFRRFGRLDRVDLIVDPARRDQVREALAARLPADAVVDLPQGRTRQVESMVRAFRLNLTALSFIALFVATFLIFNAVAMSVLRWRGEIGILRALGVTRRGVAALFLGEGLFLGVAGSLLGLAGGVAMARGALRMVSRTLTDLYLVRQTATLHPDPPLFGLAVLLGSCAAVASALAPALEAASTPPGVAMRQGTLIEARGVPLARWSLAGAGALAAALAVSWWTVSEGRPAGGFVSAFLALAGFSLLAPALTLGFERLLGGPLRRLLGIEAALGTRYLQEAAARTGATVAALMAAVGMLVALDVMVGSFRRTVDTWIGQTIRGDLYVEPVGHRENLGATDLPEEFVARVRTIPGVRAVDTFRGTRFLHGGRPAFAAGVDLEVQRRLGHLQFRRGDARQALTAALEEDAVLVSESFSHHHRVGEGDTVTLATPSGLRRARVAAVYYDYTTDAGGVLMHRPRFERWWRTRRTESLALYLAPGAGTGRVRGEVLAAAGAGLVLSVTPHRELRARVLEVFDQTFQITYALQGIAILVAVLGVVGTLTAMVLQRGREIAVLRAIGALRGQIRKMVLVESAWIGLMGGLLGCVCGLALAMILIHVINRQYFGWTIRTHLEAVVFARAVALMVVSATLAGLAPARLAAHRVAAAAMRME